MNGLMQPGPTQYEAEQLRKKKGSQGLLGAIGTPMSFAPGPLGMLGEGLLGAQYLTGEKPMEEGLSALAMMTGLLQGTKVAPIMRMADLPEKVKKAFGELGNAQRGKPEAAMLEVQKASGGGVLPFTVEHVGDLSHRMSHMLGSDWTGNYERAGHEYVSDKVDKTLRTLTSKYGFEREFAENIANNAKFKNIPVEDFQKNVDAALKRYADEHRALPAYNKPQWLARESAVALGDKDFDRARSLLSQLQRLAKDESSFEKAARAFDLDEAGNLVQWIPEWRRNTGLLGK